MATNNENKGYLLRQFEIAWKLTWYHLQGLTTQEHLWQSAPKGLHVYQRADGKWIPDWPESEGYDIGPPSIAWLTWHMGFWWSMVLNHSVRVISNAQMLCGRAMPTKPGPGSIRYKRSGEID